MKIKVELDKLTVARIDETIARLNHTTRRDIYKNRSAFILEALNYWLDHNKFMPINWMVEPDKIPPEQPKHIRARERAVRKFEIAFMEAATKPEPT